MPLRLIAGAGAAASICFALASAAAAEPDSGASARFPLPDEAPALPSGRASFPLPATTEPRFEAPRTLPAPAPPTRPLGAAGLERQPDFTATLWTAPPPDSGARVPSEAAVEDLPAPRRPLRDAWVLSVDAVTHAPVDAGAQAGLVCPCGLRLSAGWGVTPSPYLSLLRSVLGVAAGRDASATAVVERGLDRGQSWRLQAGIRPFRNSGVYLDAGYAELRLSGDVEASEPGSVGGLAVESTLRAWLVELGYQTDLAGTLVLAVGVGVMGTLDAETRVASTGAVPREELDTSTAALDEQVERYGYVPTLALRVGFDLI